MGLMRNPFGKTKAEKARDYFDTLEGRRELSRAIETSDEAVVELLGAQSFDREEPVCPTCNQHWGPGQINFTIAFDDNSNIVSHIKARRSVW